ncbi:MAG: tyrosine--tRNA ligase [Candidatus Altiarchaeota archaeon]
MNLDLLKRNTAEIVTDEELNNLIEQKKSPVAYCGYEVSGPVHIGTMVTINKQLDFLNAGLKVKVLLADLHTLLNMKGELEWIEKMAEYWKACFEALGLKNAEYVRGSDFQLDGGYFKSVLELGLNSTLNRALRSMQEIARDIENARVSQVIYPLMQIADIRALDADIAYGGMEQRKIHMLAREILPDIGFGKPICIHTPLICSIKGPETKMSSSKPETMIAVDDTPEEITNKIKGAYCPIEEGVNPILDICRLVVMPRTGKFGVSRPEKFGGDVSYDKYEEVERDYLDKRLHPMDLKNAVASSLIDVLKPVRDTLEKKGISRD